MNIIKNIIMGISVGAVFFHTDAIDGIFGVLFQGMLFIMLGAFTVVVNNLYISCVLLLIAPHFLAVKVQ